jgi:hypothetical protein
LGKEKQIDGNANGRGTRKAEIRGPMAKRSGRGKSFEETSGCNWGWRMGNQCLFWGRWPFSLCGAGRGGFSGFAQHIFGRSQQKQCAGELARAEIGLERGGGKRAAEMGLKALGRWKRRREERKMPAGRRGGKWKEEEAASNWLD